MVRGGENDPPPVWSTRTLEEVYMWFLDEAQVKESWIEAIRDVKHVNERFPAILLVEPKQNVCGSLDMVRSGVLWHRCLCHSGWGICDGGSCGISFLSHAFKLV
jgi:hypothetical protein